MPAKEKTTRSEAAKKSWNDERTRALRGRRTAVSVYFTSSKQFVGEYGSVREAFQELKLPLGVHIRFRGKVKQEGHAVFADKDDSYKFCARCQPGACKISAKEN